jgi:uncharacterized protein (DUF885 family)
VNQELANLADEYWAYRLETNPTEAHYLGDYSRVGEFEDASRDAEDRDIARYRSIASRATSISPNDLTPDERTTREALVYYAGTEASILELRTAEFGVDPIFGLQTSVHTLIPRLTLDTPENADAMVDKYRGIAANFNQKAERLRSGLSNNHVNAEFAITSTVEQIDAWLSSPVEQDSLLNVSLPGSMSDDDVALWRKAASDAVAETVRPALCRYRDVLADELAPAARPNEQAGLWALSDGDLIYSRLIEKYTTMPMQAGEIHEIGLAQIARLEEEYAHYGPDAVGTDNVHEIYNILRTDPSITHTNGADIIAQCEAAFERARAEMSNWFRRFPQSDCGIEETQHGAIAYYFPPSEDGTRAGTFFMNTSDPSAWGHAEVEGTAFHEGIPGHHMQIAIAQEMGNALPDFRRNEFISAYGEGWGLYAERLANEMGLYSGPLDLVGMLQGDSKRACRLVVDTGMHALGWTRQQGIDYMWDNSPLSMQQIVGEIDRYLSAPGQALSYMMGRLEIDRIRSETEAALGERFDIKGFHDTILGSGCVPLATLDRIVNEWAASVVQ